MAKKSGQKFEELIAWIQTCVLKNAINRSPDSAQSIAELVTSDVEIMGKKYRIEIIAPGAGKNIPAGTTVAFRTVQLD